MNHFQISLLVVLTLAVVAHCLALLWLWRFFSTKAVVVSGHSEHAQSLAKTIARKANVGEARIQLREKYALDACAYAEQLGGNKQQLLASAIGYFQKIDASDNGQRDFTDAEIRLAIEAHLGKKA